MNPIPDKKNPITGQHFPDSPGVYLMKNDQGSIIYIGKAVSLKKRVRSYFTATKDIKTRLLQSHIAQVEIFPTRSEVEALLLENNLIKRWKPKYNINLKDGKTYPVIKLTAERYPRVYRTRRLVFDGSQYFGPFPKVTYIDTYLNLIDKTFPLRKCRGKLKERAHPCLNYHIGRCSAPCVGKISHDGYMENVDRVRHLLSGKTDLLLRELKDNMRRAAKNLEFEKAGTYRDQIAAIEAILEEQKVVDFQSEARDYLGFWTEEDRASLTVLQMRGGQLINREYFLLEGYAFPGGSEEFLDGFLAQYYRGKNALPRVLYLSRNTFPDLNAEALSEFLGKWVGGKLDIKFPQKGRHAQLLRMAIENSKQKLLTGPVKQTQTLKDLQRILHLPTLPRKIEGFDIAHLSGKHTVASMVCFVNGYPRKSEYRHYHIRSLQGKVDDFKAIREVVARRYTRLINEKRQQPDLVLIDGGKGQVSSAQTMLNAIGLPNLPVVGLAKQNEELFLPGQKDPVVLAEASDQLRILQAVRDEAHRFSTSFHKKLRDSDLTTSVLEQIPGIGRKRSQRLLQTFGSVETMRRKSAAEIAAASGLGIRLAREILDHLN